MAGTVDASLAGMAPGTCSTGSVHDMNVFSSMIQDPLNRSCVFCHTPHHAEPTEGPLWNHQAIDSSTPSGWMSYQWASPQNSALSIFDPLIGPSRLCMSCHDGVTAIDQHGGTFPNSGTVNMSNEAAVGRNMDVTDDHPIGFSYSQAVSIQNTPYATGLADPKELFATSIIPSTISGTYNTIIRNGKRSIRDVLFEGDIVTCASCHDVHNCDNAIPDPGNNYNYLIWAKEEHSLICISCHLR